MQQVADWLERLGVGQYAKSFADNGIDDISILHHLTIKTSRGLVLLGHRRKMLHAIAFAFVASHARTRWFTRNHGAGPLMPYHGYYFSTSRVQNHSCGNFPEGFRPPRARTRA
jgi:hypothetical protein